MAKNLVVDLDNTLIKTDLLQLSIKKAINDNALLAFAIPLWLMKGNGYLKDKLAQRTIIEIEQLPYNKNVINYIKKRRSDNHVVLATASHHVYAEAIAKHLSIFDEIMASDKTFNLSGKNKADKLVEKFGSKNFDYIGDHIRDLPIWQQAATAIIVKEFASKKVLTKTQNLNRIFV